MVFPAKPLMRAKPILLAGSCLAFSCAISRAQTTYVWDNGAGTNNISTNTNWSPDGVPTSTSTTSDTIRWDGSVAGNLNLSMSGAFGGGGGTSGVIFDVTAAQTGNLAISGNTIRVQDISVASGAGAVSVGAIQIGGRSATTSHAITINSALGMTQGTLLKGGGGTRNLTIGGTGDYTINGTINPSQTTDSNGFNIVKEGAGTLFLNADSFNQTNAWNSNLSINGGAVRISNGWALGTVGGGGIGITTISSNAGARLELTGGIIVSETIDIRGKSGGGTTSHIVNVSGQNTLNGALTLNTGGNDYNFTSHAGRLTVSSDLGVGGGSTASKILRIAGNGGTALTGTIGNGTGTLSLVKNDGGTLELTGDNSYGGGTTVSAGTLLVNNASGSGTGSGTVIVSAAATIGGTGSIAGALNVSGVLSPGASIETFASGTLSFFDGSTFAVEVDSGVSGTVGADLQKVYGNLNFDGEVALQIDDIASSATAFAPGTTFSLINYTGSWDGGFFHHGGTELSNNAIFAAGLNTWRITYDATDGGSNFASEFAGGSDSFVNITVVPEPAAALIGSVGLLVLLGRRRKS